MRASILMAILAVAAPPVYSSAAAGAEPDRAHTCDPASTSGLVAADWQTVERAKLQIESREGACIPALIALLNRDDSVPLTGTADLIYPGAKKFYGHGFIVDYDLDRIGVRAAWVLEEIAFEDFGFSESALRAAKPGKAGDKPGAPYSAAASAADADPSRLPRLAEARTRATAWWTATGKTWTRYAALNAALTSDDTRRQVKALDWIRYGKTPCAGLSPATYTRDLLPSVQRLAASSDKNVREEARLLLKEGEAWWTYKTQ